MDWKLEVVVVSVTDVDRAKEFYAEKLGFPLDVDHDAGEHFRVVQVTPPGSACSITIGDGITSAEPGSVEGMQVVVESAQAARDELVSRGVEATEVLENAARGAIEITSLAEESRPPAHASENPH